MRRLESGSTRFTSNGHVEPYPQSPKAKVRFENALRQLPPPPDIDRAKEILPKAGEIYTMLSVHPKDIPRVTKVLATHLYEGTAMQQAQACEILLTLENVYEDKTYRNDLEELNARIKSEQIKKMT